MTASSVFLTVDHTIPGVVQHDALHTIRQARTISATRILALIILVASCCVSPTPVSASQAAGTETLVGIVGRDFVLLGADSNVHRGIALTASNVDKIATLVDPFPSSDVNGIDGNGDDGDSRTSMNGMRHQLGRQQTIVAAAAGDAADSDRLIGEMIAHATMEEYRNGWGCDVRIVSSAGDGHIGDGMLREMVQPGLDVDAMAHMARGRIASALRSGTPLSVCLLIAGMTWTGDNEDDGHGKSGEETINFEDDYSGLAEADAVMGRTTDFAAHQVQKQVQQAWNPGEKTGTSTPSSSSSGVTNEVLSELPSSPYKPRLYWLDEYGSLQRIQYGAHGVGSNFCLSILDRGYRTDITRSQAIQLMKDCFEQLRTRCLINSPQDPCIKCVDVNGVHWIRPWAMDNT